MAFKLRLEWLGERRSKHAQKTSGKEKLDHPAPEAGAECVRRMKRDWRGREGPPVPGQEKPKETLVFL